MKEFIHKLLYIFKIKKKETNYNSWLRPVCIKDLNIIYKSRNY